MFYAATWIVWLCRSKRFNIETRRLVKVAKLCETTTTQRQASRDNWTILDQRHWSSYISDSQNFNFMRHLVYTGVAILLLLGLFQYYYRAFFHCLGNAIKIKIGGDTIAILFKQTSAGLINISCILGYKTASLSNFKIKLSSVRMLILNLVIAYY